MVYCLLMLYYIWMYCEMRFLTGTTTTKNKTEQQQKTRVCMSVFFESFIVTNLMQSTSCGFLSTLWFVLSCL